jgi:hypothetical protein
MKKILILLTIITLLASCNEVHVDYPLIVNEVSNDFQSCSGSESSKYRLKVKTNHSEDLYIFTTEKFNIGDTIK